MRHMTHKVFGTRSMAWGAVTAACLMLGACGTVAPGADSAAAAPDSATTQALREKVKHVVVIYAENRSFDNLYGNFPGANGLHDRQGRLKSFPRQQDRDGTVLSALPPTWGGVTMPGQDRTVTQAQSMGLPNAPFDVATAFRTSSGVTLDSRTVTRDMYHRFFENQMQIHGGANDQFVAWGDSGGLVMGYFDYSKSPLYQLAREYVLADNFFAAAFGGSFLNHQYLVCACAPEYPQADTAAAKPSIAVLDRDAQGHYLPRLSTEATSPRSAMDGKPAFVKSGNLTPKGYLEAGKFHAVNTMQPPFQPSGNPPVTGGDSRLADPERATTLPAQTATTIADLLDRRQVSWKWYAGAWDAAQEDGQKPAGDKRTVIYAGDAHGVADRSAVDFQPHHQPFNYYAAFDPASRADYRAQHLQDGADLLRDARSGQLPAVAFYKPEGLYNQHPGYANLQDGDARIVEVVRALQQSPQWKDMVIVVTYDEFGGSWDHVAPPKGDLIGPGTRIPALIISPLAKKGTVDHTQYDTASVLRLITRTFGLDTLQGLRMRDEALRAHGERPMGDLTQALNLR